MPRKPKRPRPLTYASLKKRLDAIFSVWTRRRFANSEGMVACICCGAVKRWQDQQCSHFVSRSYLATRFHPENCAPACQQCNVFKHGNLAAYAAWGVNRYGQDWPQRMVSLSRETGKYSRADLQAMIEDYENRINELG